MGNRASTRRCTHCRDLPQRATGWEARHDPSRLLAKNERLADLLAELAQPALDLVRIRLVPARHVTLPFVAPYCRHGLAGKSALVRGIRN